MKRIWECGEGRFYNTQEKTHTLENKQTIICKQSKIIRDYQQECKSLNQSPIRTMKAEKKNLCIFICSARV